jgi:hypothetical protein
VNKCPFEIRYDAVPTITKRERMVASGRETDVVRVRITDAGRQALASMSK